MLCCSLWGVAGDDGSGQATSLNLVGGKSMPCARDWLRGRAVGCVTEREESTFTQILEFPKVLEILQASAWSLTNGINIYTLVYI